MSTRPKLTDALEDRILVWIRSGAFPQVAAEAEGVPRAVYQQWIERGTRTSPPPIPRYQRFVRKIQKAAGVGRIRAEIALREKDPKTWLLSGPGKEQEDSPGWSSAVKPRPGRKDGESAPGGHTQLAALIEALLEALEPFPVARQAAAEAVEHYL
jgi:hypothetical protein